MGEGTKERKERKQERKGKSKHERKIMGERSKLKFTTTIVYKFPKLTQSPISTISTTYICIHICTCTHMDTNLYQDHLYLLYPQHTFAYTYVRAHTWILIFTKITGGCFVLTCERHSYIIRCQAILLNTYLYSANYFIYYNTWNGERHGHTWKKRNQQIKSDEKSEGVYYMCVTES